MEPLPDNPNGSFPVDPSQAGLFNFSCPNNAPQRLFDVTAISAWTSLLGHNRRITYNARTDGTFGPLFDPTGILYLRTSDVNPSSSVGQPLPGVPIEPLVLRARAGECIVLTLRNRIGERLRLDGFNTLPMLIEGFNANDLIPSEFVGLHPQLLYYDPSKYDGIPIGNNGAPNSQIVSPGQTIQYQWYAGDVLVNANGTVTPTPIEFGATNLISSDRILHASKGAFGALIIEPANATWTEDTATRAAATVTSAGTPESPYREFVLQFQNDVNMRMPGPNETFVGGIAVGEPVPYLGDLDDSEDTGQKAINYRTEPLWKRMQHAPDTPFPDTDDFTDWYNVVANTKVGGVDPQTPVFTAEAGQPVRFRLLQAGGHSRNIVFALHGHVWDKEPYIQNSTRLGRNGFSFWEGARMGHGPSNHFDVLVRNGAGGAHLITGDYLFRDQVGIGFDNGLWGILRVN